GEGENVRSLTSDRDSYCRVTISLPTASQFSELIPTSVCCPGQYSFRQNANTINLQRAANKLFGSRKYFGRSFEQAQFVSKLRRSLPVIRFTKDVFFDKGVYRSCEASGQKHHKTKEGGESSNLNRVRS